jgi:hypothetical protein
MKHTLIIALGLTLAVQWASAQLSTDSLAALRLSLVAPRELQDRAMKDVALSRLGYEPVDMLQYGSDHLLLRSVSQAFRNVWTIPTKSGQYARSAAKATSMSSLVRIAGGMSDVSAGRMTTAAIDTSLSRDLPAEIRKLPVATQRLVAQIVRAADDAAPFLHTAFRGAAYESFFSSLSSAAPEKRAREMYRATTSPWTEDRQGQYASTHPFGLDALDQLDRKALTFCGVILTTHLDSILAPWLADMSVDRESQQTPVAIQTKHGWIVCTGPGVDTIAPTYSPLLAVIDAGGDDVYLGRTASTMAPRQYFSIVIDRNGNDRYESRGDTAAICAGVLGVAILVDVSGDDRYIAKTLSIAAAFHGVAVMQDRSGNDTYELEGQYGQGAATAGIAVLDDHAGNDTYICAAEGQAYAQTLGGAILVDRDGNDDYLARLDGAPSEMYLGQTVSRAQGAAFGRRADMGDGHSLAGGAALLLDLHGNDTYTAGAWSQGCGYWWALGMLEDWDGADEYTNGKYSLGAGAHFAIGVQVDLMGNDAYNVGNSDVVNQYQGHARDGSIGVSIDGAGDDRYVLRTHCGGSGDLCSIGWFWDRNGNDIYECDYTLLSPANGWTDTPPLGTTTRNEPFGTFRDEMPNVGMFMDGGGTNDYRWRGEDSPHKNVVRKGYSVTLEP